MRTAAPPTPTAKQRQILKTLDDVRESVFIVYRAGTDSARIEHQWSIAVETILPSTFHALAGQSWIEERTTWSQTGVSYWFISDAGREALR